MPTRFRKILITALFVVVAVTMTNIQASSAQASGPRITAINISSITSNSATVSYTTSTATTARVVYDTSSHSQAADYASATDFTGIAATSNQVFLAGLTPSTTYHYRLEVKESNGTTDSADRTFATISAAGGPGAGTSLLITGINYTCVGIQCRIAYSTNINATVQIRWGSSFQSTFGAYPNSSAETAAANGARSLLVPPAGGTPLQLNTTYHYRIQAIGSGAPDLTNDLTFTTGASSSDHTFSTGTCPDGTVIGACNSNREYCASGGNLVTSCTSICGLTCGTGQTCNNTGQCVADPSLSGSPYQCNQASCYDPSGQLVNPAPAGCYSSWPKCNANTILKVQKDRGCNLWLTCATSLQTEPTPTAPAENLCLSLAACNSLGLEGQCNKYLPQGQCSNDPLRFCSSDANCTAGGTCNTSPADQPTQSLQNITYQTPEDVAKVADLSGNVVGGLDWHQQGGSNVIEGMMPWQLMRQVGGNVQLKNGDFEYNPPDSTPWEITPLVSTGGTPGTASMSVDFEDRDNNINHVLEVNPVTSVTTGTNHCQLTKTAGQPVDCTTNAALCTTANDRCLQDTKAVDFSGVASGTFTASAGEYYYAEARIKAPTGNPHIRFQFGYANYSAFTVGTTPTYVDVNVTNAWQRITLGPIKGMSGETRIAAVCNDTNSSNCSTFWLDDVQVRPVLQADTNPTYITPSCRLYPKEDSPACDYVDQNNVVYKGWHGYCLEHDSQTGTCLSWWPVDIIKGESNVFGADTVAGYQDRAPLYLCAEGNGNSADQSDFENTPYSVGVSKNISDPYIFFCQANGGSGNVGSPRTILLGGASYYDDHWGPDFATWIAPTGPEVGLTDRKISSVILATPPGTHGNALDWLHGQTFESDSQGVLLSNSFTFNSQVSTFAQQTWPIGPLCTNGPCKVWAMDTVCIGQGGNCTAAWIVFSKTGVLERYGIIANDETGDKCEPTGYQFQFHLRELCSKFVQVVDPNGNNQAFASRVNSSSYQVPDLKYTTTTDAPPFGGAIAPTTGSLSPINWPMLPIEKPDFVSFPAPGQARAGSPYACNGECNALICTTDHGNDCSTTSLIGKCQNPDAGSGKDPGECVGTGAGYSGTKRGAQLIDPAIDPSAVAGGGAACTVPKSTACTATTTVSTSVVGGVTAGPAAQTTLINKCKAIVACDGTKATCAGGTVVRYTGISNFNCSPPLGSGLFHTCTATCTVPAGTTYQSVQAQVSDAYFAEQAMRRIFAQSYGVYSWDPSTLSYAAVPNASLGGVTKVCPNDGATGLPHRPDYPNDFCAVPPTVTAPAFLNSTAKVSTVTSGSGSVGLKFNSNADADQVPLNIIRIDWGDNQDSFSYPFAPRNDPAKPHIFSHAYVFSNNSSTQTAGACNQTSGVCTYHIKIQIQDNWSWCTDTKTDATSVKNCSTDTKNWYDTGLTVNVTR